MPSQVSLYKRRRGRFDIHRRGEGDVKTEAETEVIQPQAKECWQLPEPERGKELTFLEPLEGVWSC